MRKISKVIMERLKESKGKRVKVFLKDKNFKYEGTLINFDETWIEIFEDFHHKKQYKSIRISDIKDMEVSEQ